MEWRITMVDDPQGDFSGGFGTDSNPATQLFQDGGGGPNKTRLILLAVVGAVVIGGAYFYFSSPSDSYEDDFVVDASEEEGGLEEGDTEAVEAMDTGTDESEAGPTGLAEQKITEPKALEESGGSEEQPDFSEPVDALSDSEPLAGNDPPVLMSPEDGMSRSYDETSKPAKFTWGGSPGGWILFSRSQEMSPVAFRIRVKGNSFEFRRPHPGTWYWQVKNAAGTSGTRSFSIKPAVRRSIELSSPMAGGSVLGSGGVVSWTGDTKVAYYRVEFSNGDWAKPQYSFATSGTQIALKDVPPGTYELRLGALSEVSARWEYTEPVSVTVQ